MKNFYKPLLFCLGLMMAVSVALPNVAYAQDSGKGGFWSGIFGGNKNKNNNSSGNKAIYLDREGSASTPRVYPGTEKMRKARTVRESEAEFGIPPSKVHDAVAMAEERSRLAQRRVAEDMARMQEEHERYMAELAASEGGQQSGYTGFATSFDYGSEDEGAQSGEQKKRQVIYNKRQPESGKKPIRLFNVP